jgi:MSHA pilin protein MshC
MGIATARGFTLTELVMVMVLIGILAAFAAPRLNIGVFDQLSFGRELTSVLNHARNVAQASGCPIQVTVDAAANSYLATYTGAGGSPCASTLSHPTRGGPLSGSGEITSGGSVTFDGMGRTGEGLIITLADGQVLRVEAGSGHVH